MSAADRESFAGYVATRLDAFREHAGWSARVWDVDALARARRAGLEDADAFRGPWRTVRPYVSTDFRVWIEEYYAERLTYTEWQAAQIHARREESERQYAYMDSAEYTLDRLEQWAELNRMRDELIADARERGASFAELQAATGLSRMAVHNVITRERASVAAPVVTLEPVAAVATSWIENEDGEWIEVAA